jgi:hypothetical protein
LRNTLPIFSTNLNLCSLFKIRKHQFRNKVVVRAWEKTVLSDDLKILHNEEGVFLGSTGWKIYEIMNYDISNILEIPPSCDVVYHLKEGFWKYLAYSVP